MLRKNPLIYTKEGHLSLAPVVVTICVFVGLGAFILEGAGVLNISTAGWAWLGGITGAISGGAAAVDRKRLDASDGAGAD